VEQATQQKENGIKIMNGTGTARIYLMPDEQEGSA
jgi:hypothetical protein